MLSRTLQTFLRRQSVATRSTLQRAVAGNLARCPGQEVVPSSYHRCFSDGSHDDFAPQKKAVSDDVDQAIEMIQKHVDENPVMLYMKGNPSMPMCGFSAQTVQVLQAEGVDFSSVNVLDYPSIREGVKKFAAWPTIPQLYINGEFIGGCDIVKDMHESGELKTLLAEAKSDEKK